MDGDNHDRGAIEGFKVGEVPCRVEGIRESVWPLEGISEVEFARLLDGDCVLITGDIGVELGESEYDGQLTGDEDTGGLTIGVKPTNDGLIEGCIHCKGLWEGFREKIPLPILLEGYSDAASLLSEGDGESHTDGLLEEDGENHEDEGAACCGI